MEICISYTLATVSKEDIVIMYAIKLKLALSAFKKKKGKKVSVLE